MEADELIELLAANDWEKEVLTKYLEKVDEIFELKEKVKKLEKENKQLREQRIDCAIETELVDQLLERGNTVVVVSDKEGSIVYKGDDK